MWTPRTVTLGLLQFSMKPSADENFASALTLIEEAADKGAQIVCLPELFLSPYFCQTESCAVDFTVDPQPYLERLSAVAKRRELVVVTGSFYEKSTSGKGFNTSFVIDADGCILGKYRKVHIPHDPGFYEGNYFDSGDVGFPVFKTRYGTIAVLICFDQWFPEAARSVALQGAEIIFYPTAIGVPIGAAQREGSHYDAWQTVQRGHAIANSCVVAAVNRSGVEEDCFFFGGSFVANAFGTVLQQSASSQEGASVVAVDLEHSRYVAREWMFGKKRLPAKYSWITKN